MNVGRYIFISVVIVFAQAVLLNFLDLSWLGTLLFCPAVIICLPVSLGTVPVLAISFATGFLVDFLSNGVLGLTACALLPLALSRKLILRIVFGEEMFVRNENLSFQRFGLPKMGMAFFLCLCIFFLVYVWADGAGTRPFWFSLVRFVISVLMSVPASLLCAYILIEKESDKWK